MSNVIPFSGVTKLDLDPDIILEANKGKFEGFVIIGRDKEGSELFVSTYANGGDMLWLLERCKQLLLKDKYE